MHLPGGGVLRVVAEPLAHAIAEEWQAAGGGKGGEMSFADTPLTRLAGTAQQRIAPDPGPTIDAIARYAESDLLCYRAEAPEALVRRQARAWQPWLDWAALTYDAPLRVSTGVALREAAARQRGGAAPGRGGAGCFGAGGAGRGGAGAGQPGAGAGAGRRATGCRHGARAGLPGRAVPGGGVGRGCRSRRRRRAIAADIALAARFLR